MSGHGISYEQSWNVSGAPEEVGEEDRLRGLRMQSEEELNDFDAFKTTDFTASFKNVERIRMQTEAFSAFKAFCKYSTNKLIW